MLEELSDKTGGLHFRVRSDAEAKEAVIKAGQMQNAMRNKVRGVMKEGFLLGQGLLCDRLIRECHIAQKSRGPACADLA